MTSQTVYGVALPIILFLILLEAILSAKRHKAYYKRADTWASLGLLLGNIVINGLTIGTVQAFYFYLYQFRAFDISVLFPAWAQWLLAFVAIDFVFYWYHRASHRTRGLWAIHMNHHSSEEMNFVVAFRQAWLGPLSKIPFFLSLPLLGLDPSITMVAGVAATLWGVWGHTQIIGKLGPLEWVFNTPSHHRVHHGTNPQYIDKNYGNLFIVWDRIFGTFEPEDQEVVYGLTKNVNTFNPFVITIMGWRELMADIKVAPRLADKFFYPFAPLEWIAPGVTACEPENLESSALSRDAPNR
jgi:sterol desaturase/sphingolipid hydroxylase (fatty acid hydroxylase superfamily)